MAHVEEWIKQSFALAVDEKPAYAELFPWLERLYLLQTVIKGSLKLDPPGITNEAAMIRWSNGFPLLKRSELPVDAEAAENLLRGLQDIIPFGNEPLRGAAAALLESLVQHAGYEEDFWTSFLQEDLGPWEEWIADEGLDIASVVFVVRSCLRPAFERAAEDLIERFPVPDSWLKGYCPVCGSLPALLLIQGEGERRAFCSWCGTEWGLSRLECPWCENKDHDSLGYLYVEDEPLHRIQYCVKCRYYFKQLDLRERLYSPFLPLEEWTTLHLDLIAQRAGWLQPPSASPRLSPTPQE